MENTVIRWRCGAARLDVGQFAAQCINGRGKARGMIGQGLSVPGMGARLVEKLAVHGGAAFAGFEPQGQHGGAWRASAPAEPCAHRAG